MYHFKNLCPPFGKRINSTVQDKNIKKKCNKKKKNFSTSPDNIKQITNENSEYLFKERCKKEQILQEIKKGKLSTFSKEQKLELAREIISSNSHCQI
jgi:DNA polymerase II small subunit/DNA polymerase delta subunit B